MQLHNLQFSYPGCERALKDVTLDLPKGSRTLLLGANGAFKTTLLQLIAGKYMVGRDVIRVLQQSPFYDMVGAGYDMVGGWVGEAEGVWGSAESGGGLGVSFGLAGRCCKRVWVGGDGGM